MKRTQSFSFYALLIALLVHLIIVLLIMVLNQLKPSIPPQAEPPESQKERFKLSLKEIPSSQPEAIVKNDIPKVVPKLPIPKGEQLLKKTQSAPIQPIAKPTPAAPTPTKPAPQSAEPIVEPKKAFERHVAKTVAEIQRQPQPKKEQGLYDILSKADTTVQERPQSSTKISDSIQRLYGDKFNELSEGEQRYILDNQEVMRRITQGVLDRYGRSRIPDNIRTQDTNMIEFYLHPNGSISDIRFLKNSQLSILDDTTKEVIELAYAKYPRPQQKTLIRYRVFYNLTGY